MDISQSDINMAFDRFNSKPRNLLEAVEANRLKNQQEQARQLALRKEQNQVNFDEQNNPLKLAKSQFDNMSQQDKIVEQDLLQGSIELQPFLDAKDSQSVMQLLQVRRNKLAQAGLRTDEIDGAIQLAQQGNFDALKQLTGGQIKAGKLLGLLEGDKGFTAAPLQVSNAIQEALDAGDLPRANAIALSAKIFDKGQEYKDTNGTIGNIVGYVPSVQDKSFATGYGTQSGKDTAYAGQGMTNFENKTDYQNTGKINTSKAINDDEQATKSYYDNLRIENLNNGRLTLQERQAEDTRLQKERDAELAIIQSDYTNNAEIDKQNKININKNTAELQQKDALKIQELTQNLPIAENVTAQVILGIDDTINKLEQAKSKVGSNTAGWEGLLKIMPVSDYNDLKAQLKTLNSRFGLDSLIKLKSQGGTLGQIAVKEFEALQDSVSNLTQSQRPEQLRQNMDDAIRQLRVAQDSIERAFQAEYGRVLGQPQEQGQQPQTQPQQSNQIEFLGFE